ncbi:MAG TPA: hypothetical protein VGB64_08060 [Actinomycetota bacterium]
MRIRRVGRRLALGALVASMAFGMMPAQAGTTGLISDATGDVVDFVKHTQNSFRPSTSPFPSPFTTYQRACRPESGTVALGLTNCAKLDVASAKVDTNASAQTMTFQMSTAGAIPPRGGAVDLIPAPFAAINYAWYFATTSQESPHQIGIECTGGATTANEIKDDFSVNGPNGKVGAEIHYTPKTTCPAANTPQQEAAGQAVTNRNALSNTPVMSVVHPQTDGWRAFVEVAMGISANGSDRLDGQGKLACSIDPTTGQPRPLCIDYELSIGEYEGYSGVAGSNSHLDFSPASRNQISFSISGGTITATVPWNPTTISADGDLYIDDARSFPWRFAVPGQGTRFTNLTAETTGLVSVGVNSVSQINAVCEDSTDNPIPDAQEPFKSVGAAFGQANRQIANTTNQVFDQVGLGEPGQDDGFYIWGNGGTEQGDCIRGITGLLTLLDWTQDSFELRIYPRNPGYLPSASGVNCRYPIGQHPLAIVLVANVVLGPNEAPAVDVNTSPFDRPYSVRVFANSNTPAQTLNQAPIPDPINPPISPLAGTVGRDTRCNYTYHVPGLHYFGALPQFTM